jgi:hypothetical protein
MKEKELKKIKDSCYKMLVQWAISGKKLGVYKCKHCKNDIPCRIPDKKDVSSKGFWDSTTICLECGNLNFVKEYPNGKTIAIKMG